MLRSLDIDHTGVLGSQGFGFSVLAKEVSLSYHSKVTQGTPFWQKIPIMVIQTKFEFLQKIQILGFRGKGFGL